MKKLLFLELFFCFCYSQVSAQTIREKADDGDAIAQYALATMLLEGNEFEKDTVEAVSYLMSSAKGGDVWTGIRYTKETANTAAERKLLELSKNNSSDFQYAFLYALGSLYFAKHDFLKAERYLKQSVELKSGYAMFLLGVLYFYIDANIQWPWGIDEKDGPGFESYCFTDDKSIHALKDFVKNNARDANDNAAFWLEKAVELGYGSSVFGAMPYSGYDFLLFSYVDGVGIKPVLSKAVDVAYKCVFDDKTNQYIYAAGFLEYAAEKEELFSKVYRKDKLLWLYNNLGDSYVHTFSACGLGVIYYKNKEYKIAFKYLLEAANASNQTAMKYLAECYKYGRGTTKDLIKEKEWRDKAGE